MNESVFKARAGIADGFEFINGYLILTMWLAYGLSVLFVPQLELVLFSWAFASSLMYGFKFVVPLFRSDYQLVFKDDLLLFQQGEAVLWTVPYKEVSHIGVEKAPNTDTRFIPIIEETYVYTLGKDKFLVPPGVFEHSEIDAIQREIELRKVSI